MSRTETREGPPRQVLRLRIAYDGTALAGSQRQAGKRTVQEELESAVASVFARPVPVYLAGRTDSGVHARGQIGSCADYRPNLSDEEIVRALDAVLPSDVAVTGAQREPIGFHARYAASWREYRYWIWTGPRQPLVDRYVWCEPRWQLDQQVMQQAADKLVGEKDFASFVSGGEGVKGGKNKPGGRGTVRTIHQLEVLEHPAWWGDDTAAGRLIGIRVVADGFLPRMVRGIVGALTPIGNGKRPAEWIDELLDRQDRRSDIVNAPAHGLTLWNIGYGTDQPGDW